MKGFLKEFQAFAMKGNVVDLAVAVVIGGAFGKIVSSLVADIIMPLVGIIVGGVDFTGLTLQLGDIVVPYGNFMQTVVDFVIVAFCIFMLVKAMGTIMRNKEKKAKKEAESIAKDIELLTEIRDLLKKGK